jgi:hypothetical protein
MFYSMFLQKANKIGSFQFFFLQSKMKDHLVNFCVLSNTYYTLLKQKQDKERSSETIYASIWQMVQQNKSYDSTGVDGKTTPFVYKYTAAILNKQAFDQYKSISNELEQYVSNTSSLRFELELEQELALVCLFEETDYYKSFV